MRLRFVICDLRFAHQKVPHARALQSQIANHGSTELAEVKSQIFARRGFSFPELLFAVAVLGIGFIMVAAIFPVAILQTQASIDDTNAAAVAMNAQAALAGTEYMNKAALPYTSGHFAPSPAPVTTTPPPPAPRGCVFSFNDPRITPAPRRAALWRSVRGSLISDDDPRYAFIPLYIRDAGSDFAELMIVGVRVRGREVFERDVDAPSPRPTGPVAELEPRPVKVIALTKGLNGQADIIRLGAITAADDTALAADTDGTSALLAAGEGAYIVISDDKIVDDPLTLYTNEKGQNNGRMYRLGIERTAAANEKEFELSPELAMASNKENLPGPTGSGPPIAFVVGRGYRDPKNPTATPPYGDASIAVQRYQTVWSLK